MLACSISRGRFLQTASSSQPRWVLTSRVDEAHNIRQLAATTCLAGSSKMPQMTLAKCPNFNLHVLEEWHDLTKSAAKSSAIGWGAASRQFNSLWAQRRWWLARPYLSWGSPSGHSDGATTTGDRLTQTRPTAPDRISKRSGTPAVRVNFAQRPFFPTCSLSDHAQTINPCRSRLFRRVFLLSFFVFLGAFSQCPGPS